MKRAIVFAHFDRDGLIDPYVLYLISQLRPYAETFVFVSTSAQATELGKLDDLCDVALTRANVGYDFMSWKTGIDQLRNIADYDEITFVNDSIYGPLFDIGELFRRAEKQRAPFWGLVSNNEAQPHIQSFFFSFRKELLQNGVFEKFWRTVEVVDDKWEIIQRYEIGMSSFVAAAGGSLFAFFDQRRLSYWERLTAVAVNGPFRNKTSLEAFKSFVKNSRARNPTHVYWRSILKQGIPFLKIELLRSNPQHIDLDRVYRYLSRRPYDVRLIENHLRRCRNTAVDAPEPNR